MSVGVDGLAADHAERASGADNLAGALGESTRRAHRHADPEHLGSIGVVVIQDAIVLGVDLRQGIGLDDDLRGRRVPSQAHDAGAELFLDRLQLVIVDQFDRSARGNAEGVALERNQLVEDLVDFLGELGRLLLLQRDTDQLLSRTHLQVEGALPRNADGADDDAVRPGELVNSCRHGTYFRLIRLMAPCVLRHRQPARPRS